MNNLLEETQSHSHHTNHEDTQNLIRPLLSVADFNGDGYVNITDIRDIVSRYNSAYGDDLYHPLYDMNADGNINFHDIIKAVRTYGEDVPLTFFRKKSLSLLKG